MSFDRRRFLLAGASGLTYAAARPLAAIAADPALGPAQLPSGTLEAAALDALPGKLPLIKKSWRPPNFETPVSFFNEAFTPNNAFFVRYHLANIPQIAPQEWRLRVGGDAADKPYDLTLAQLRSEFAPVEVNALCICSGNRRGLSDPHVPGVQWGYGAMGNARWKGVRLKEVLARAGIRKDAVEIMLDGADAGVLDKTPDFVKSIPAWKAMDENTLLAYEMNGEALPHWNGYPVRVVVPGWTATYWMKHVTSISALSEPLKGFWMSTAYRIPKGKFPVVDRFTTQETDANTPITEMVVASLITSLTEGQRFAPYQSIEVKGVAWDGGYGIAEVEVSQDGGRSWRPAELLADLGRFSWRQWRYIIAAPRAGAYTIMAKATNRIGASQTFELNFNPAGYHNNVVQRVNIQVG
jgi:DMSO/TMAO reductase YedYZ molybdopterin-dependent catalytic subunit